MIERSALLLCRLGPAVLELNGAVEDQLVARRVELVDAEVAHPLELVAREGLRVAQARLDLGVDDALERDRVEVLQEPFRIVVVERLMRSPPLLR